MPEAAELRDIKFQVPLQVYSRDGRLIAEFGEMKRTPVAYADIPPLLVKAVLATEDEHFFEHPGVDYRGVIRGASTSSRVTTESAAARSPSRSRARSTSEESGIELGVRAVRREIQGVDPRVSHGAGVHEGRDSRALFEHEFFGQRSYGVATAAQTYFGKPLGELSVSEIAILAGIPQRPTAWNPVAARNARRRAAVTCCGACTKRARSASSSTRRRSPSPSSAGSSVSQRQLEAPYLAEMVRAEMVRRFGNARDDGRAQSHDDDR